MTKAPLPFGGGASVGALVRWWLVAASWHDEDAGVDVSGGDCVDKWSAWVGLVVGVGHCFGVHLVGAEVLGEFGEAGEHRCADRMGGEGGALVLP